VSVDGGDTWSDAAVEAPELGPWAWPSWTSGWGATPG